MEMKKIACAILFAAASVSAVMADEVAAPAPSPASGASASLPIVGSLVGASLASFIAVYLQISSDAIQEIESVVHNLENLSKNKGLKLLEVEHWR
ncbi:hypothetical protein D5086_018001 [Populus alba]|uniref:Uncharacterized protein n=1 Tax=Populus alba TaxID=43335 RepID=A0ACC4BP50_POPAL